MMQAAYREVGELVKWFNRNNPFEGGWNSEEALGKSQEFKDVCNRFEKLTKKVEKGMSMLSEDTRKYLIDKYAGKNK